MFAVTVFWFTLWMTISFILAALFKGAAAVLNALAEIIVNIITWSGIVIVIFVVLCFFNGCIEGYHTESIPYLIMMIILTVIASWFIFIPFYGGLFFIIYAIAECISLIICTIGGLFDNISGMFENAYKKQLSNLSGCFEM